MVEKLKKIFKKVAVPALLVIVTLLAVKFYMWNDWKIDRAIRMVKGSANAPAAVNLVLSTENETLFETSFAFNPGENVYLVNLFDISPYIKETNNSRTLDLTLTVNRRKLRPDGVYCFENYNIIAAGEMKFVFTSAGCDIHCLIRLRQNLGDITAALIHPGENKSL